MKKIIKIKYLYALIALFAGLALSGSASAASYWINCPMEGEQYYTTACGPTTNDPELKEWECECKHPTSEGEFVVFNVNQVMQCHTPAADNLIEDPPAPQYCVGSGPSIPSANGDDITASFSFPGNGVDWMTEAPRPDEIELTEGFWKSFFHGAIPNGGNLVEQYLTGPHSNEGLDDPETDLYFNSARNALTFCQRTLANKCSSDWHATLQNCSNIPSGKAPNGKTTFQYCIDGGTENSQNTTLKDDLFACLDDVQTPGKGPWDSNRTRKYYPNTTKETYAADSWDAAEQMAEECIMELWMHSYPMVAAFDSYKPSDE